MAHKCDMSLGWQAIATGRAGPAIADNKRARSEVRAFARSVGIKPARQQAPRPKRAKRQRTADQQHGPVRSLSREEIARLGYASTKPVEPVREAPVDVMNWRRGRKLSPDW